MSELRDIGAPERGAGDALGAKRYWIFDLDGTLTVHQHDFDAIRAELGVPRGRLILEYLASLPGARAAPLYARLVGIEAALAAEARPADGAATLLAALAAGGAALGILTRNTRSTAHAALAAAGLAHFFVPAAILGRDQAAPKPAADGIVSLLADWHGRPEAAAMVGDHRLDLEAGRNAGVTTVHVGSPGGVSWPLLTDHRVASLYELHEALAGCRA